MPIGLMKLMSSTHSGNVVSLNRASPFGLAPAPLLIEHFGSRLWRCAAGSWGHPPFDCEEAPSPSSRRWLAPSSPSFGPRRGMGRLRLAQPVYYKV